MKRARNSGRTASPGLGERRRSFLRRGLGLGLGVGAVARVGAAEPGRPLSNYGQPSVHEKTAIRWVSANPEAAGNGVSWTPLHELEGTVTPNPLHFERHHNGVPDLDPSGHRLCIDGQVNTALSFDLQTLSRYPKTSRICFIECGGNSNAAWASEPLQTATSNIHGMVANSYRNTLPTALDLTVGSLNGLLSCSEWTGIPLRVVLDEAGVRPEAAWLIADGADAAGVSVSLPLAEIPPTAMIALWQNGERVRPENGYPMRLLIPGWEGICNVKWLERLSLATEPAMSRYETASYTDLYADGKARRFSFRMGVKSLICFPSPGHKLERRGLHEISGLAWSGAGRIDRVEVSTDAGRNWQPAVLEAPVRATSLTRFRLPWHWRGEEAVLQSRAWDEHGRRQPDRDRLLEQRGANAYYHYNAVVSWAVSGAGNVRHVYA